MDVLGASSVDMEEGGTAPSSLKYGSYDSITWCVYQNHTLRQLARIEGKMQRRRQLQLQQQQTADGESSGAEATEGAAGDLGEGAPEAQEVRLAFDLCSPIPCQCPLHPCMHARAHGLSFPIDQCQSIFNNV